MNRYDLTQQARQNLIEIRNNHLERGGSVANANKLLFDLYRSFRNLADFPELGTGREYLPEGLRALPHKNIMIYYKPQPGGVIIVHVFYGASDLETIFSKM